MCTLSHFSHRCSLFSGKKGVKFPEPEIVMVDAKFMFFLSLYVFYFFLCIHFSISLSLSFSILTCIFYINMLCSDTNLIFYKFIFAYICVFIFKQTNTNIPNVIYFYIADSYLHIFVFLFSNKQRQIFSNLIYFYIADLSIIQYVRVFRLQKIFMRC